MVVDMRTKDTSMDEKYARALGALATSCVCVKDWSIVAFTLCSGVLVAVSILYAECDVFIQM